MNLLPPLAGAHTIPGKRSYQHDRYLIHHTAQISLLAVADGHGPAATGHIVSDHIYHHLIPLLESHALLHDIAASDASTRLQRAIADLDTRCLHATAKLRVYAGSTLCLVLYDRLKGLCLVANVGDSRVVMVRHMEVCALSRDHVPTDVEERARIEAAGGWVLGGMLNGYVSMSRALGDEDLKAHRNLTQFDHATGNGNRTFSERLFTGEPDVRKWEVGTGDLALVVASDGVWGRVSNHVVADVVRAEVGKGRTVDQVAKSVVKKAMAKGNADNVTVIVGMVFGDGTDSEGTDSPRDVTYVAEGKRKKLSRALRVISRRDVDRQ